MNRQLLPLVVGLGLLVLACSLAPQAEIGPTPAVTVTKRVIVTPKVTPTSPLPTVAAAQTVRVAADGSGGQHGVAAGQFHAGIFLDIEELEYFLLLAVVRAGRVAGGRAYAAIVLADQRFIIE